MRNLRREREHMRDSGSGQGDAEAVALLPAWLVRSCVWLGRLGGGLIFFMAFPITIDVLTRKLFNVTFLESYEISTYSFAIACACGYAYALVAGAHIRIDVVYARAKGRARCALDFFAMILLSSIAVILAWHGTMTALASFEMGARSNSTLGAPLALPQGLWAMGLVFFAVVATGMTVRVVWLLLSGRTPDAIRMVDGASVIGFEISRDDFPADTSNEVKP